MEPFLKKTYGLLVYQDDCLYTAIELAGYNWVEVDKFRKAIGKKIPEEMAAQKEKFIQGCIKNGYSQTKAEEIFRQIEPFTSYGFNKAHAASYGMLAYRTAYMKANYPVEYMCALLTAEADDLEKIAAGVEECRKMGVIISPPDVNLSFKGFEMEPNDQSLGSTAIRFGFDAIKNVGDAAIDNIITERNQNGPFLSFNDFCLRVDGQKVNKKVIESLIKVGALDRFGPRNALLLSIDKIRQDCERLKSKHVNGQFGLFDDPKNSSSKPVAPKDDLPVVDDLTQKEKLALEKELLGIYITENPISKMLEQFQAVGLPKIADILTKPPDIAIKAAGIIAKTRTILTKKNNSKMAFITLEDETGKIEVVVFPKVFEQSGNLLTENRAVYIEGKTNLRDSSLSILADIVSIEPPSHLPKYDFIIHIPPTSSQAKLVKLNNLLKKNPNGHRGLIILPNGKNVPLSYGVRYDEELKHQIDQILA